MEVGLDAALLFWLVALTQAKVKKVMAWARFLSRCHRQTNGEAGIWALMGPAPVMVDLYVSHGVCLMLAEAAD